MSSPRVSRLAKLVKIYLDLGWILSILAVIVLPIVGLLVIFGDTSTEDADAPELPILLRFHPADQTLWEPVENELSYGQGDLSIRTRNKPSWLLLMATVELIMLAVLYLYGKLRAIMRSVLRDQPFDPENAGRIRKVGLVVVIWGLAAPFLKYFSAVFWIERVSVTGLVLKPPIDFNLEILFLGLAIIVLSEIFNRAAALQKDQSLTV
jgi:hypothetical protein